MIWESYNREKDKTEYNFKRYERPSSGKTYSGISVGENYILFSNNMREDFVGKQVEVYSDVENLSILIKEAKDSEYARLVKHTKKGTTSVFMSLKDMPKGRYYFKGMHEEGYLFKKAKV